MNIVGNACQVLVGGLCVALLVLATGAVYWLLRYMPQLIEAFLPGAQHPGHDATAPDTDTPPDDPAASSVEPTDESGDESAADKDTARQPAA